MVDSSTSPSDAILVSASGSFDDFLEPGEDNDYDWYRISPGAIGTMIAVDTVDIDFAANISSLRARFFDQYGNRIGLEGQYSVDGGDYLVVTNNDPIYAAVYETARHPTTGAYRVIFSLDDVAPQYEASDLVLEENATRRVTFDDRDDIDSYSAEVEAGYDYGFQVDIVETDAGAVPYVGVSIYDEQRAERLDAEMVSGGGGNVLFTASVTQTLKIDFTTTSANYGGELGERGDFDVSFIRTDTVKRGVLTEDEARPGLILSGTVDTSEDSDWFRFQIKNGVEYLAHVQGDGGDRSLTSANLGILDSAGGVLESRSVGTSGDVSFTANYNGVAYVAVASRGAIGDYFVGLFSSDRKYVGTGGDDLMNGSSQNNIIKGGAGDDRIFGEGGNDRLFGGAGDDRLAGGIGDDLIVGGGGADTIRFANGDGRDTLKKFGGGDQVDISDFDLNRREFKQMIKHADDTRKGVEIHLDGDDSLFFVKLDADDLHRGDFIL